MKKILCKRCNEEVEPFITEQPPHIRADCPICLRWIKWMSTYEVYHAPTEESYIRPTLESIKQQHGK